MKVRVFVQVRRERKGLSKEEWWRKPKSEREGRFLWSRRGRGYCRGDYSILGGVAQVGAVIVQSRKKKKGEETKRREKKEVTWEKENLLTI